MTFRRRILDQAGKVVAYVFGGQEHRVANANLINAAPEMLEALKGAAAAMREYNWDHPSLDAEAKEAYGMVVETIDYAEGRDQ